MRCQRQLALAIPGVPSLLPVDVKEQSQDSHFDGELLKISSLSFLI